MYHKYTEIVKIDNTVYYLVITYRILGHPKKSRSLPHQSSAPSSPTESTRHKTQDDAIFLL